MSIRIVDFNNFVRRRLHSGQGLKQILQEAYSDEELQIWVSDGFNCNARRRAIFPDYKASREPPADDIFKALDFIKKNLVHTSAIHIEVPTYEADDVIAHLVKAYEGEEILIESNDLDLAALTAQPGVSIARSFDMAPQKIRLMKTLVGDSSDSIPGLKGFGPKTFDKYDLRLLEASFQAESEVPDVRGLPERVQQQVRESWPALLSYWKIIGFFPLTDEEIKSHMKIGEFNPKLIQYPEY